MGQLEKNALPRFSPILPTPRAARILVMRHEYMLQVRHGLAEAHAKRIVYRDLKLANLFWRFQKMAHPASKFSTLGRRM